MATVNQILAIARKELGTAESPAESNRTKYGSWFGLDGQPWCMMFVQWVFHQAGTPLPFKTASCSALLEWYRTHLPDRVITEPQPGDVVLYSFGHTGIVETAGTTTLTAIEGNTSPGDAGSQANGGMVCRRTRRRSLATAFLRPDLQKEVLPMDNTPSPAHKEGVDWAKLHGILTGDAQGDFMLSQAVTRQQFCTMLLRFAQFLGKA